MSKRARRARRKASAPFFGYVLGALLVSGLVGAVLLQRSTGHRALKETVSPPPTATVQAQKPEPPPAESWREAVARLPAEKRAEAFAKKGDELMEARDWEQAAQAYRASLDEDPSAEAIHYNLGLVLAAAGKTDEAIAAYEHALKLAPDYAEAHNNLGNLLMRKRQYEEALQHFREAARINPKVASTYNNIGIALANEARHHEATEQFARAVSLDTNYFPARLNLAQSHRAEGDTNAARRELEELLRDKPDFTPAQKALDRITGRTQAGR